MNPLEELAVLFEKFPGIGPRQARRFVHYLLTHSSSYRRTLARHIEALGNQVAQCDSCFRWFAKSAGRATALCEICADAKRDRSLLFVLEKDSDMGNVERSGFRGLYFVLGGTVPLAEEHPEEFIRAKELLARVKQDAQAGVLKEVILGLSATAEGDHTRLIVEEKLLPLKASHALALSTLGRGLSTGSELEYADPETISQALGNRH